MVGNVGGIQYWQEGEEWSAYMQAGSPGSVGEGAQNSDQERGPVKAVQEPHRSLGITRLRTEEYKIKNYDFGAT